MLAYIYIQTIVRLARNSRQTDSNEYAAKTFQIKLMLWSFAQPVRVEVEVNRLFLIIIFESQDIMNRSLMPDGRWGGF